MPLLQQGRRTGRRTGRGSERGVFWIPHKAAGCRFYSRGGVTRRGRGAGFGARGFLDSPQSGRMPLLQPGRRTGRGRGRGSERGGGFTRSFRRGAGVPGCWGVGVWPGSGGRAKWKRHPAALCVTRRGRGAGFGARGFLDSPQSGRMPLLQQGRRTGRGRGRGSERGGGFTRSFRRGAGVVGCWGAGVWPGSGGRPKWKRHPAALCVTRRGRGAGFGARGFLDSPQSGRMPLLQQGRRTGRRTGRGSERGVFWIPHKAAGCRFYSRGGERDGGGDGDGARGVSGFPTKRQDAASTAGAANGTGAGTGVGARGREMGDVNSLPTASCQLPTSPKAESACPLPP
jgi:hypothetical protein